MTVLTSQAQIANASTADLVETYNAMTGKAIKRFSSRGAAESQVANAILQGQDRAAHAGVPKGTKRIEPVVAGAEGKPSSGAISEQAHKQRQAAASKPVSKKVTPAKKAVATPMGQLASTVTKKAVDAGKALKAHRCPLCNGDPSSQTAAGKEGTVAGDERALCHDCGQEYWTVGEKAGQVFARRSPGRDAASAIRASWTDSEVRAARSLKQHVTCDGVEYRSVREAFAKLSLPLAKHIKFRMELKAAGKATFRHADKSHKFEIR